MAAAISERWIEVRARIEAACRRADRDPTAISVIWVSKTHPMAQIREAFTAGARDFGESRAQELLEKFPLPGAVPTPHLHFIGRLQSNKSRKVLPLCQTIHSVDSLDLLVRLDRLAGELGLVRDVFLQVNASREGTKTGFDPGELRPALRDLPPLAHLVLRGLMTIGPNTGNPDDARDCFRELRTLLASIRAENSLRGSRETFNFLSMGMSDDFEIAIEEGSHFLRLGTILFGAREPGVQHAG